MTEASANGIAATVHPESRERARVRRDIATGQRQERTAMIRFVADPGGRIIADLAEKLPGRGVWLSSDRDSLLRGLRPSFLSRSLRRPVIIDDGLANRIPDMLRRRLCNMLGLAKRSGQLVSGFDRVQTLLKDSEAAILVAASDASPHGTQKLVRLAGTAIRLEHLSRGEIGRAIGRAVAVHAVILPGKLAEAIARDATRLSGFTQTTKTLNRRADGGLKTRRHPLPGSKTEMGAGSE